MTIFVDDAGDIEPTREANPADIVIYRAPMPMAWQLFFPLQDDGPSPIGIPNGGIPPSSYA